MPKHEQSIVHQMNKQVALATCYQVMQQLGWTILFAGENSLQAVTESNWKKNGQRVICEVGNELVNISSEMANGELIDLTGKNKKNCQRFYDAFSASTTPMAEELEAVNQDIHRLRENTALQMRADEAEEMEVDQAMNLSGSNLFVTYGIIAVNVLVFILMIIDGAGMMEPNGYVHLKWGSNFAPLTLSGDWWRLLSNVFIHFGVIHIAMNMYCLYTVGIYLEPMLGKIRYLSAYLCTGVLASVVSLWWHNDPVNSAGASGAVFGVYGVFLALLTSNLIPKRARTALLQNIGVFVAFNLLYGLKGGIDNAAHIGGLLTGIAIGYAFMLALRKEKEERSTPLLVPALVLTTILVAGFYIDQHKNASDNRSQILNEITASTYKDSDRFNAKLNEFDEVHGVIDAALGDTSLTYQQLSKAIDETGIPQFEKAATLMKATASYEISPAAHKKATLLLQYTEQKKNELQILKQLCVDPRQESLMLLLTQARKKSNDLYQEAIKL